VSVHGPQHEERLASLLSGERDAADPDCARWLAECAPCRERWTALRGTCERLEQAAAERRAHLAELRSVKSAPGEERIAAALRRLAEEEPPAQARSVQRIDRGSRRWLLAFAAAAVLAGVWIAARFRDRAPVPERTWLGSERLRLIAPVGDVHSFERFEWSYDGAATSYTLRVFEARGAEPGARLIEKERLKETTWTPAAEDLAKLPRSIVWEVEALDDYRVVQASGRESASLSR